MPEKKRSTKTSLITCNIIEFLINKVLDEKPLVSFIIKDYSKLSLLRKKEEEPSFEPPTLGAVRLIT